MKQECRDCWSFSASNSNCSWKKESTSPDATCENWRYYDASCDNCEETQKRIDELDAERYEARAVACDAMAILKHCNCKHTSAYARLARIITRWDK